MCCVVLVLLAGAPRFGLFLLWLFTDRLALAFEGWVLPVLGFFLLPWTTAFYVLAYAPLRGVEGIGWLFVLFGFLLDIGSYSGGARSRQERV